MQFKILVALNVFGFVVQTLKQTYLAALQYEVVKSACGHTQQPPASPAGGGGGVEEHAGARRCIVQSEEGVVK